MGWGWTTPAQRFGMSAMRYLHDTGCTTKAFAEIAVAHRYHASLNPKARLSLSPSRSRTISARDGW